MHHFSAQTAKIWGILLLQGDVVVVFYLCALTRDCSTFCLLEIRHLFDTGCGHGDGYYSLLRVNGKLVGTMRYHGCRCLCSEMIYGNIVISIRATPGYLPSRYRCNKAGHNFKQLP